MNRVKTGLGLVICAALLATDTITFAKKTEEAAQVLESCDMDLEGTDCVSYPYETCQMIDS